jgi:hypothetical protein
VYVLIAKCERCGKELELGGKAGTQMGVKCCVVVRKLVENNRCQRVLGRRSTG